MNNFRGEIYDAFPLLGQRSMNVRLWRRRVHMLFALLVPLACMTLLAACGNDDEAPGSGDSEFAFLNHDPEATYVGKEACRACHPSQYDSFTASQMGRSFRLATRSNSDAEWEGISPIYDEPNDLYYLPIRRGEDLFVKEYRLAGRDTVHQRVEQIDYIVGSGQHTNSHMRDENGFVYQIPVTWYSQDGIWDMPPGFGSSESQFDRPIPEACMTCHNAMPGFVEGSENRFSHVPEGIDCERCHGPGSIHVREMDAGNLVDVSQEADLTIVNPRRLSPVIQMDICESCHNQGATVYREGMGPSSFRPGMRLEDIQSVFMPRDADSTSSFVMASHPVRLRMSACFEGSHEPGSALPPMTCLTCHNPHISIESYEEDHYEQACQSCHASDAASATIPSCTEPTVVSAGGSGDCVSCHMPDSGTSDIPHVVITDHYIRTPSPPLTSDEVDERKRLVRFASLVGSAPTDLDFAKGYLVYFEEMGNRPGFLDSAAVHLDRARQTASPSELAPSLIRLDYLRGDFAPIRSLVGSLDDDQLDAWTLQRVGESFAIGENWDEAVNYFQRAVNLAPGHLRFRRKLANALSSGNQLNAALDIYNPILTDDPTFDLVYNDRGFTYVLLGDNASAEDDFLHALSLNPNIEMALANLASLYYNTGRTADALAYAQQLVRRVPENPAYRQFLDLLAE